MSDSKILATIAKLFIDGRGVWPYPRELALALGGAVPGLSHRIERLMAFRRVGYDCCGGTRRILLLLDPSRFDWKEDPEAADDFMAWVATEPVLPAGKSLPTGQKADDYFAAILALREHQRELEESKLLEAV
jgi:hypothetical protein